jgi:hypothetical protein
VKQNISPGVFMGIILVVIAVIGVAAVLMWRRTAAAGPGMAEGPGASSDPSMTAGQVRSHPDETMEQRRARIFGEHAPGRVRGDK